MSSTSEALLIPAPAYCYRTGDDRALLTRAIESEATNRQCVQYLTSPFVMRPPRVPVAMRAVEQALDAMHTFGGLDLPAAISGATTRAKASARSDEDAPDPSIPPGKETLARNLTEANAFLAAADKADSINAKTVDRYVSLCKSVTIMLGTLRHTVLPDLSLGLHESQLQLSELMSRLSSVSFSLDITFRDAIAALFALASKFTFHPLYAESPADLLLLVAGLNELRARMRPVRSLQSFMSLNLCLQFVLHAFPEVSLLRRDLDLIPFPTDTLVFDDIRIGLFNWSQLAHTMALHHCKDAKARSPAMIAAAAGAPKLTPTVRVKDLTDIQIRDMAAKHCNPSLPCPLHPDSKHHLSHCATFLTRYLANDVSQRTVPFDNLIIASKPKQIQFFTEFKTSQGSLRYPDVLAKLIAM
jgi:hypothetical protein